MKRLWILVLMIALVLPIGTLAAPPAPITPGPQPKQWNDYVVNTFIARHVNVNGEVRLLQYATLWLMNRTGDTIQAATIDSGHGHVRMNMAIGDDYWWAIYPLQEFGNTGQCRVVLRNAEQMIVTEVPVTRTVTFYGPCDALGAE